MTNSHEQERNLWQSEEINLDLTKFQETFFLNINVQINNNKSHVGMFHLKIKPELLWLEIQLSRQAVGLVVCKMKNTNYVLKY